MKTVTFQVDITNASTLKFSDIEQIYDLIECALRGKQLYTNEYQITTIIS